FTGSTKRLITRGQFTPFLTALATNPRAAAAWFATGVPDAEQNPKAPFTTPQAAWLFENYTKRAADNGTALGAALKAGLKEAGNTEDAARATMGVFRQLGSTRTVIPAGAKEDLRWVFGNWVNAVTWNTVYQHGLALRPAEPSETGEILTPG